MRRIILSVFIGLLVSLLAALVLFMVDFNGPMKRDAAFEAYVQSGNNSILPPNTLDKSLDSAKLPSSESVAWKFFSLVWLRQRTDLLMIILVGAVTVSLAAGLRRPRQADSSS